MSKVLLVLIVLFTVFFVGASVYLTLARRQSSSKLTNTSPTNTTITSPDGKPISYPNAPKKLITHITPYSAEAVSLVKAKKRVLFFTSKTCSTCATTKLDLVKHLEGIPTDTFIFLVEYDQETALKDEYSVKAPGTLVSIDKNGKEIKQWKNGGFTELLANTK